MLDTHRGACNLYNKNFSKTIFDFTARMRLRPAGSFPRIYVTSKTGPSTTGAASLMTFPDIVPSLKTELSHLRGRLLANGRAW
jgi:hypothetical protein